jgi:hypothetical protein
MDVSDMAYDVNKCHNDPFLVGKRRTHMNFARHEEGK